MCHCEKSRYQGEQGKQLIISLAKKSKAINSANQAVCFDKQKNTWYYCTLEYAQSNNIEIFEII